jgi:pimeloyl-ACP methyl ester carboxylesterase
VSEAPLEPENYTDGGLWADDVAAIVDQLDLEQPVLVGWSYGAFVICDYLRVHGQDRVAAINFVEGAVKLGEKAFGTLIGPGFLDHFVDATADDLPTNIRAMRAFLRDCVVKPLGADDFETALCWNIVVPARIRASLAARDIDSDDVLRTLEGSVARHAWAGGHGGAARDGRARPRDVRHRRGVLVRRRRSRAAPAGARALQPRAGRADAPGAPVSVRFGWRGSLKRAGVCAVGPRAQTAPDEPRSASE